MNQDNDLSSFHISRNERGAGAGKSRIMSQRSAEEKGDLKPLLKAQVSWIIARQDRAWYATGLAKKQLLALGQTEDQIYKLDGDWKGFTEADRVENIRRAGES